MGNIHVATILPTYYLALNNCDEFHMSLAQLINITDKVTPAEIAYREFYRKQAKRSFVLLDNGCAEGEQPTAEELVPKILAMQPTETILPDTLYDGVNTCMKGWNALSVYEKAGICDRTQIMAVPQGETFSEWCHSMQEMITWGVDTIGVSKFITAKYAKEFKGQNVRLHACQAIRNESARVDIHLLGCYYDPREVGEIYNANLHVRSVDSAIGYVYARVGRKMLMNDYPNRPEGEIHFHEEHDANYDLVASNKGLWRGYCEGYVFK